MATQRKLQQHVTAVESSRRRYDTAKAAHDALLERIKTENAAIFDEYEAARQAKDDAEKAAREAITATPKADLPVEFGHRVSTTWHLGTVLARKWLMDNLPALMKPDAKAVTKVLNTGVFEDVPIIAEDVITATISEKLGRN